MELKDYKLTLHNLLKKCDILVEFTKANGEYRKMRCTLRPNVLPENPNTNNSKTFTGDENHAAVWDLDANGWRSFIFANIISYEVL